MEPVDRYVLTGLLGWGTQLEFNGQRTGILPGVDVMAAYGAIRPGPDPINEALKIV